jgi:hypothetical protein
MSKTKFQLVAVDDNNKKVQILNEDSDYDYLERIADNRDGMVWLGSNLYDLKVVSA